MKMENLGTIAAVILAFFAKEFWDIYKKRRGRKINATDMTKSIEFDVNINDELSTLRDRYDFNRAALYDFSNGSGSLSGMSFKNVSMRYERVDLITKPIIRNYQNIPCSNIASLLLELNNKGMLEVKNDVSDVEHEVAIQHQRVFGVIQSYYFRLGDNLVNGCVCLSTTTDIVTLTQDDLNDIKAACDRILWNKERMPRQR